MLTHGDGKDVELLRCSSLLEYPTEALAAQSGIALERLENCHVRLFINDRGGTKAPLFAGCHLPGEDRLDFMLRFSAACRQRGVALKTAFPPDYIPMMIEVLALLRSRPGAEDDARTLARDFFIGWPERFAEALKQHDETGIYSEVAEHLAQALEDLAAEPALSRAADHQTWSTT